MPSPERPCRALLRKELRHLLRSKAYWAVLLVLSVLVGYSLIQAVGLYAEASRSALKFPETAQGLSPLDGILVPTFGAYYLGAVLLWPFVAIRLLGAEKESGSLQLSLQFPAAPWALVAAKAAALAVGWIGALIPGLSVLVIWRLLGGHLAVAETAGLVAGHCLFAAAVSGAALLAAALADTTATAAIGALAFTLGTWVLDFSGSGGGWARRLSAASPMAALRAFERGLLGLGAVADLGAIALGSMALAAVWIRPAPNGRRLGTFVFGACLLVVIVAGSAGLHSSRDLTEDRRHSFAAEDERALRDMTSSIRVEVHLSAGDSRRQDFERGVLGKLRRVLPRLIVIDADEGAGLTAGAEDNDYGWIFYSYQDKTDKSTSNSEEEILSILHGLAGRKVSSAPGPAYPGYPLAGDVGNWAWWFYGVLPMLIVGGAWACRT